MALDAPTLLRRGPSCRDLQPGARRAKTCSELATLAAKKRREEGAEAGGSARGALLGGTGRRAARGFRPLGLCRALPALLAAGVGLAGVALHRAAEKIAIDPERMRWVRQSDGRLLEYTTCGRSDGAAVYWASGYFSTANFIPRYACDAAERLGLRLLSISMPGFGLSDSYPLDQERSLLDWPRDVELVLAQEAVRDVFLMGTSTGCVHAAAFAHAFPERVLGMMMNSPTAPHEAVRGSSGMSVLTHLGKEALDLSYVGSLLAGIMALLPVRAQLLFAPDVLKAIQDMERLGERSEPHREISQHLLSDMARYDDHTYRGVSDNMHTIVDELPFELGELSSLTRRGLKVWITTAPDDAVNPPAMQRWWSREVLGSELLEFDAGWGHFHAFPPENLDYLLGLVASTIERQPGTGEAPPVPPPPSSSSSSSSPARPAQLAAGATSHPRRRCA